jgi:DNA-binding CsgD family transcriptional regulator
MDIKTDMDIKADRGIKTDRGINTMDSMAEFINACDDASNLIDFREQIYPTVKNILPHSMFACGSVCIEDLRVVDFINISFPDDYLEKINLMSCPVLLRWLGLKSPVQIDTNTPLLQSTSRSWFNYFGQHRIKNLTVHGVVGANKKHIYFFVFGGINVWTEHEVLMLKLLVPQLYCTLIDLDNLFNSNMNSKKILTPREEEVLTLICKGKSNAEVARILHISGWTVKIHVSNLIAKLKASNRSHAVAKAIRLGLLTG